MSTATPNLASWERRFTAAVFDNAPLLVIVVVILALDDAMHWSPRVSTALLLILYAAYHSLALLMPTIGFGRIVAGISVVSIREDGNITTAQAISRPSVRIAFAIAMFWIGEITDQEWLVAIPVITELMLIRFVPTRQSLADFVAGTIVVNTPQPDPHRAPAGPMFSASDSEFGSPPKKPKRPPTPYK